MTGSDDGQVLVEGGLGPEYGYYHDPEVGAHESLDPEEMSLFEAEERGYSPCGSCFPEIARKGYVNESSKADVWFAIKLMGLLWIVVLVFAIVFGLLFWLAELIT